MERGRKKRQKKRSFGDERKETSRDRKWDRLENIEEDEKQIGGEEEDS